MVVAADARVLVDAIWPDVVDHSLRWVPAAIAEIVWPGGAELEMRVHAVHLKEVANQLRPFWLTEVEVCTT